MSALGSYYPAGVNEYVPNMQYAADVDINGHIPVDLSPLVAMLAASATGILNAQSIAAAVDTTTFVTAFANNQNVSEAYMGRFGRNVTVVASGAAPYRDWETDRKSTRLNSSHRSLSRMPSSA